MAYYSTRDPSFILSRKKEDKVKGKSIGPRSDDEIGQDILARFGDLLGIDTSTVGVEVSGHIAILRGSVANPRVKKLLMDVSGNVPGVKEVKTTLQVDAT